MAGPEEKKGKDETRDDTAFGIASGTGFATPTEKLDGQLPPKHEPVTNADLEAITGKKQLTWRQTIGLDPID